MLSTEIEKFITQKKYPSLQPKAVFFDMDGVLFDSMKNHAAAWVEALNKLGLPFTEIDAYMNEGRTGASTIDGVFNKIHNRNATEEEKQQIYKLKSSLFEARGEVGKIPFSFELLKKIV